MEQLATMPCTPSGSAWGPSNPTQDERDHNSDQSGRLPSRARGRPYSWVAERLLSGPDSWCESSSSCSSCGISVKEECLASHYQNCTSRGELLTNYAKFPFGTRWTVRQMGCHRNRREERNQAKPGIIMAVQFFGSGLKSHVAQEPGYRTLPHQAPTAATTFPRSGPGRIAVPRL